MDPCVYLSQGRFHRSIHCRRTNVRVSFALVGAWSEREDVLGARPHGINDNVVLYVLPSGCSRYMGILMDGVAAAKGVRMIAIDRPGAGATPLCDDTARIHTATEQTLSVLEYMGVTRPTLFCHSAGWLYVLQLLSVAPEDMFTPLRLVTSSPFVPTHVSGSALGLLPKGLVNMAPAAFNVLRSAGRAVSWSSGLASPLLPSWFAAIDNDAERQARIERNNAKRQRNKRDKPKATFHPPFTPLTGYALDAWKRKARTAAKPTPLHPRTGRSITAGDALLFDYFTTENCVFAAVQDFLLCLGKIPGMDGVAMEAWVRARMEAIAARPNGGGDVVLLWAENDGLIPSKGRTHLYNAVQETLAKDDCRFNVHQWIIADGGHDTAVMSAEVMDGALDFLSANAKPIER